MAGGMLGNMPNGLKLAAVALLIHQLMKHRGAEAGGPAQAPASSGGGLGGILGGLLGGGGGASGSTGGPWSGGGGAGQPRDPWNRTASADAGGGMGGGLGGLLGGLLGGAGAGGLLSGLGGLLGGLRRQGLSDEVDSWVAHGPNRAVSPDQIAGAFDPQDLDEAAREAGTDRDTLLREVGNVMPEMVDRMTPQGRMPQPGEPHDAGAIDDLLGGLGLGRR